METTVSGYLKRAPLFNQIETNFLMDQVEIHKRILLHKSTKGPDVNRKKRAWRQIEKAFTEQARQQAPIKKAFSYRSDDVLKNRWDNLKRLASKHANSLVDVDCDEKRATLARVLNIISEADKISSEALPPESADDDCSNDGDKEETAPWEDRLESGNDKQSESMDEDVDDIIQTRKINRSANFSSDESRLLLQCVRPEKKYILSNDLTAKANLLKHQAWDRVTAVYNRRSRVKRSHLALKIKFENMKRMAKRRSFKDYLMGKKHQKLENENTLPHRIKAEPISKDRDSTELTDDGYNDTTADIPIDDEPIEPTQVTNEVLTLDPLSTVLNGNVGNHWMQPENSDVVRLQMDLLNSQIETAKLERQRVMNKMQAEVTERHSRELETSLRLRAARLEAVAAEMKLPLNHPALEYTPNEIRGQQYINGNVK